MAQKNKVIIRDTLKAIAPENEFEGIDPDEHETNKREENHPGTIMHCFRKGVNKIRSSPQRLEHYRKYCKAVNKSKVLPDESAEKSPKQVILDIRTRWDSTFAMIERGLEM
ncbi:hypothetical protein DFQ28_003734 [Apophysomyces sp. BC1034]|nr:hypothetical protein DFQ29_002889 [Apophysomyces sp. BC1021]KAG0189188.1 hypothetical protein DFQ28_003734 [Apophysomyces sp. BC1034]